MIAIIAALKEEVHSLLKHLGLHAQNQGDFPRFYEGEAENKVVVVEGGIGKSRAETATIRVIEEYHPEVIISAGFAGGAKEGPHPGDLILCQRLYSLEGAPAFWHSSSVEGILESNGNLLDIGAEALRDAGLSYQCGVCLTVPQFIAGAPLKQWIGDNFQVDVIDMESYCIARVAQERGISFLAVRAVLDPAEESMPTFVGETVAAQGRESRIRAIRYAIARPAKIPAVLRLSRQAQAAQEALSQALWVIIDRLKEQAGVLSAL